MAKNTRHLSLRGSRRRISRIGFWENWSVAMTICLVIFLVAAFIVIPWLSRL